MSGSKCIHNITEENFYKYGKIIDFTSDCNEDFQICMQEERFGWRIAVYRYTRRTVKFLENHPTSKESFEPLSGTTLLIVSENHKPNEFDIFLLDKPVCLFEGIWHQVITLSQNSQIKITENLQVNSEFHYFENELIPLITTI